jgi:acetyl esterase/lipase
MQANAQWSRIRTGAVLLALSALVWVPAQQPPAQKKQPPAKAVVPEGAKVLRDLVYARAGEKPLLLDLYLPEEAAGPLPVLVWVHGGGWRQGSKDTGGPALRMVRRGYAVASINYRLSSDALFPAQIEDCKAAVRWLRANATKYRLDPDHIGAWGSSAGGHLVALLGTTGSVKEFDKGEHLDFSSRVQAVCDWFGPTDFLQMDAHAVPGSRLKHNAPTSPESLLIGGPIQENKEKVARANPITYVTRDAAPFLIVHGDKDPAVPIHQSELLRDALTRAGVEVKLRVIEGGGHGGAGFSVPEVAELINAFFDRHLKNAPAQKPNQPPARTDAGKPQWVREKLEAPNLHWKTFQSPTINQDVSYLIYLPPGYDKDSTKRFPVMYWLHGRGGSQQGVPALTQRLTRAIEAGQTPPMIVVFVNGLITSGYEDRDGQPVETVSIKDLIPHIDRTYRTIAARAGRLVEGFSMGGGGAAKWGFKYPDLFGAVSILAGARMTGEGATASQWVQKNADAIRGRTIVRIVVGGKDGLVTTNRAYHALLTGLKIDHEFHVIEDAAHAHPPLYNGLGEKNWEFYRRALRPAREDKP